MIIEGVVRGGGGDLDCEEVAKDKRKRTRRKSCFTKFANFRGHQAPEQKEGQRGLSDSPMKRSKVTFAKPVSVWGCRVKAEEMGLGVGGK